MARRVSAGLTLMEMMIVITVILVLAGILIPAVNLVRNKVRRAEAMSTILGLATAVELYRDDSRPHRYPPMNAEKSLVSKVGGGGSVRLPLDLLQDYAFNWRTAQLDEAGRLCDPWRRHIRYHTDEVVSTPPVPDRPAPVADWNPQGREPFAYIWSLGQPSGDDTADADPAHAARWLYRNSAP
jgi:prepilin-type N-terminal cleavage/methylation domain-containing protein